MTTLACLQYGFSGPCIQQVCLVCEPSGDKIYTGVTFLTLFSKYLSDMIIESQSLSDMITIILPVHSHIVNHLLNFLSKSVETFKNFEDAFEVGKTSDMLGIGNSGWQIDTGKVSESLFVNAEKIDNQKEGIIDIHGVVSEFSHFLCDICGKSYRRKGSLMAHSLWTHSGSSPTSCKKCPICKKRIKHVKGVNDMAGHINHHLDSRRKNNCNLCQQSFKQRSHLTRHIEARHRMESAGKQIVQKSRLFSCDVCGKSYTSRGTLMAHSMFKHAQTSTDAVISKECPVCKKIVEHVKRVSDMGSHIEMHFRKHCDICDKSYAKMKDLILHKKRDHKAPM